MLRDNPEGSSSRCSATREFFSSRVALTARSRRTIAPCLDNPGPAKTKCVWSIHTHYTFMLLTIDTGDSRPIYQQVADGVKELIARGQLAEGASLPPVRQLAADLGVNLNTVATAYRELQKDGLIVTRHGSGSVVASRTITERSRDQLVRPLRTALTELVLSGLSASKIQSIVRRELRLAGKEAK